MINCTSLKKQQECNNYFCSSSHGSYELRAEIYEKLNYDIFMLEQAYDISNGDILLELGKIYETVFL
jgi:hypothetical protein